MSIQRVIDKVSARDRESTKNSQAHKDFDAELVRMGLNTGAEIGVWYGSHAELLLEKTQGKLYGIDPYSTYYAKTMSMNTNQEMLDAIYKFTVNKLSKYDNRYVPIRLPSEEAFDKLPDNLDYIYVDGNHSYEGVFLDMKYILKVKKGGLFGGHDYANKKFRGVSQAVNTFAKILGKEVHSGEGSVWWLYV